MRYLEALRTVPDTVPGGGVGVEALRTGLANWIQAVTGLGAGAQGKLLTSLLVLAFLYLLRRLIMRLVDRRVEDPRLLYQWSKSTSRGVFVLGFLMVVSIWFEGVRSLGTFLGLLSAGVAIALKDLVASLAGWGFILWRRPFQLGDRIQIGSWAGDVVDIRIFQFTILEIGNWVDADQSTGRVIHIPNGSLFTEPLANYTTQFEYIWNEIPVPITFESDWRRAKEILQEIAEEAAGGMAPEAEQAIRAASRKFLIHFRKLTPRVYTSVKESGILLTLRYLCPARQRRGVAERIWEAILEAFAREAAINFAYPTTRVYLNPLEGKEEIRAPLPPGLRGDG